MSEIGEVPINQANPVDLPDIGEHAKLVEAAKKEYQSIGSVIRFGGFPKDQLDTIYLWWSKYPETKELVNRLDTVTASDALPKLEQRDIGSQLTQLKDRAEPIVAGLVELIQKERIKPHELQKMTARIRDANSEESWHFPDVVQAIALGEVLIETTGDNLNEREMRIRIAQGAWEELLIAFTYSRLHYAADTGEEITTQGMLKGEKEEIASSLRRKPWGKRQVEKNRKIYLGLRKQIRANEYDEDILVNLKLVWDSARGAVPSGKSALEILYANELVLSGLSNEGAFEWDLEDIEEEGEGEEED